MNHCRRVLVTLVSPLVFATLMAADTGTLKIQVRDSEGAVLGGSYVIIRPDATARQQPSRATTVTTITDRQGQLAEELEPGFFDVCLMFDAFVPQCQKARILSGRTKEIALRMKLDPDAISEIGDTFPKQGR